MARAAFEDWRGTVATPPSGRSADVERFEPHVGHRGSPDAAPAARARSQEGLIKPTGGRLCRSACCDRLGRSEWVGHYVPCRIGRRCSRSVGRWACSCGQRSGGAGMAAGSGTSSLRTTDASRAPPRPGCWLDLGREERSGQRRFTIDGRAPCARRPPRGRPGPDPASRLTAAEWVGCCGSVGPSTAGNGIALAQRSAGPPQWLAQREPLLSTNRGVSAAGRPSWNFWGFGADDSSSSARWRSAGDRARGCAAHRNPGSRRQRGRRRIAGCGGRCGLPGRRGLVVAAGPGRVTALGQAKGPVAARLREPRTGWSGPTPERFRRGLHGTTPGQRRGREPPW